MPLFLSCMSDIAPRKIRLWFMTLLVLGFITLSSWSSDSSGCSEWKRTFSSSNVKDFLKFQTGSIIDAIQDDILLDNRIGWIHKVAGKFILTWRGDGQQYLSTGSTLMI
jgi:hypothetical protein